MTVKEISSFTGLSNETVRYQMDKMRKEGILVRSGATKGGKWIIKDNSL